MFLIREIMYCKPGKVRPLVNKFLAMKKIGANMGLGSMRIMTDVSAERYWTIVSEIEVASLEEFMNSMNQSMQNKEMQELMKDYHDFVDHGRREIYKVEG